MKFNNKDLRLIYSKNATEEFKLLEKIVGEELKKNIKSSEHQTILKSIKNVNERLKNNPFIGQQVQKKLIPKLYLREYQVTNLWRVDLSSYWRLIYTVRSNKVEIINFVLNVVDHKDYNKIFGYKKK